MSIKRPKGVGDWRERSTAHGRVWQIIPGVWILEVRDSTGKVIDTDNTGDWRTVFDSAFAVTSAVRTIENIGHELIRDYEYLVSHTYGR